MNPALRAHLDLVAPREKASRNLPQWSIDVPRCEHGVSLLDDCAPCDERYSAETADIAMRDALAGWRYIRQCHGDLPGVGWDRVEQKLTAALAAAAAPKLSPWNAAAQSLKDAAARIAALPGDTSIALMHLQEAAEALDDWYAPGELSEADVREWERDEPLARYPLVAALEAAVRGTR